MRKDRPAVTAGERATSCHGAERASLPVRTLAATVYRRVVVMERRLDHTLPAIAGRVPVRFTLLTLADLEAYARLRPDAEAVATRRRLAHGHQCFAVWHEGQIVHAGWAATRDAWVDYLGCAFPLGAGDVYQFDSFTAPAFRGLDLAGARIAWMARHLRESGVQRLFAVVWPENAAGFRPLEKMGYRRCGWLRVVRLGRWRRVVASGFR
jgi:RimJ/RimL family protein N-acetyltransferase